jgi:hypothetical protein
VGRFCDDAVWSDADLGALGAGMGAAPTKTLKLPNEANFLHAGLIFFPVIWVRFGQTKPFPGVMEGVFFVVVRGNSV